MAHNRRDPEAFTTALPLLFEKREAVLRLISSAWKHALSALECFGWHKSDILELAFAKDHAIEPYQNRIGCSWQRNTPSGVVWFCCRIVHRLIDLSHACAPGHPAGDDA